MDAKKLDEVIEGEVKGVELSERGRKLLRTLVAAELIADHPTIKLRDVAQFCGYSNSAQLTRHFRAVFRETPQDFRKHFPEDTGRKTPSLRDCLDRALGKLEALSGRH